MTPQNATFIPEYLLPQMKHLTTDSDIFVRITYAQALVKLANAAMTMLEMSQAAKDGASVHGTESSGIVEVSSLNMAMKKIFISSNISPTTMRCFKRFKPPSKNKLQPSSSTLPPLSSAESSPPFLTCACFSVVKSQTKSCSAIL